MFVRMSWMRKFAAIATFATSGFMQGAEHGKFHLPMEAHWGESVLPPGDYAITLPARSLGQWQFVIEHSGKVIFEVAPLTTDAQEYSAANFLKLSAVNDQYFVTEFLSGATGKKFTFSVPKSTRRQLAAAPHGKNLALDVK